MAMTARPWQRSYAKGVPLEIDVQGIASVRQLFASAVERHGPRPAFTSMGATLSYDQVHELSLAFAGGLQRRCGLGKGEPANVRRNNVRCGEAANFGARRLLVVDPRDIPGLQALVELCRARLTGYKRPASIEFRPGLPKSPIGKVLKKGLREPQAAEPATHA